jgi:site-specific recombinase XerD
MLGKQPLSQTRAPKLRLNIFFRRRDPQLIAPAMELVSSMRRLSYRVESWLRRLPLAKSSCAKIRNLMSVIFNHACRYELFDRNPIHLIRQSAKRRRPPTVLVPTEIKALVDNLSIRERTLVLLASSTGLRQRASSLVCNGATSTLPKTQ